jgi:signal transduction histidine kinase
LSSVGSLRLPVALPRIERTERDRVVAGVAAGIGDGVAVDPTLVRLTFAFLAFASGAGIVAYLGIWALLPAPGDAEPGRRRRITGTVLLVWSAILALRGVGLADSLVWPLALAGAGIAIGAGATTFKLGARRAQVIAVVLIVAGVVVFVGNNTGDRASSLVAPGAVAVALLLVAGPWGYRLVRERNEEHAARVREEERAELAARVHDSVLQTLTLIQKNPDDARTLARRQERELRAWLYPERAAAGSTLAAAVETAAAEIEELHGVRVEVVRTGDAPLDERTQALVLAGREAMANAARHAGVDEVSVFLDAADGAVSLYVRDRGAGFDPEAIAGDRRGVTESIRGRMERVGGSARVHSARGEGTEVELSL